MTLTEPTRPNAPDIASQAEEVRAYVVAARGGAPFLSAADGRLLVRWLEGGISVARILAAVDEVAEKRRKKRTRGRLTLSACKRIIEGKKNSSAPTSAVDSVENDQLEGLIEAIQNMPVDATLETERNHLVRRLRTAMLTDDPERMAMDAIAAVRFFHEAAWAMNTHRHDEVRKQARQELESLSGVLSDDALQAAIEEVARDIIRREHPMVSAAAVWDRVSSK